MAGNSNSIFLQVLADYSEELQKKFLLFTTGSDRVPVGGMGEMTFKITKMVTKSSINGNEAKKHASPVKLPESHTCFNQLVLPGRILIFNHFCCYILAITIVPARHVYLIYFIAHIVAFMHHF